MSAPSAVREAAAAQLELERRRRERPLAYAELWHHEAPRTSQRTALWPLAEPNVLMLLLLGGNRSGKSAVVSQYGIAQAGGLDAEQDGVFWVRRWLARNGLPEGLVSPGPGRVWVGSPTFASAVEQIRPHLAAFAPSGTRLIRWDDKQSEAEARLPGGGVIVSKAYRQFDQDPQSWEGASVRSVILDEQPNSYANLAAAFSRLVDQSGKVAGALTPLRGKADWLFREVVHVAPEWLRIRHLHGADNPHIPQDRRALMLAAVPPWQRASRDVGAFTQPEGAIFSFGRDAGHVVDTFPIPADWTRWMGIDWGARAPHVVWAAESPAGELYCYRELAPRRSTTEPGVPARRLVQWAKELEDAAGDAADSTVYRVADSEDPGAIAEAAEQGWWVQAVSKPAGSVLLGLNLLEALFQVVDPVTMAPQRPRVFVFPCCPILIEELEGMRWAEVREGQDARPDPACPDHGPDALRYIVRYRQELGFR